MVARPMSGATEAGIWPSLHYDEWKDTWNTLHMWTQIVGKLQMELVPPINHWWHITFRVTPIGLVTPSLLYGIRTFQMTFDFLAHVLRIETNDGDTKSVALAPRSVADFYRETMSVLRSMGLDVPIRSTPTEIPDPVPFEKDTVHTSYDQEYVLRFWRVLVQVDRLFTQFRGGFIGKCSPVHFFWGGGDLAVTRFSGRLAPPHGHVHNIPDIVTLEGYSHECCSLGFWPGGFGMDAAFYSYVYPASVGYGEQPVLPAAAFFSKEMGEYFLPYEAVRQSASPDADVLSFAQSTYETAAELGNWDRAALERHL